MSNNSLKKKGKYNALASDTIVFAIGSLGSKFILFLLVPLYTNYLTTEEYGTADLVTSIATLIGPVVSVAISRAVIRFSMMKSERIEDVAKTGFGFLIITVLLMTLITPLFGFYEPIDIWKWYLFTIVILTEISDTEGRCLKAKGRNKTFSIISIIQTIVLALTNLWLIKYAEMGVAGYLLGNIAALFFVTIASFFSAGLYNDIKKGSFNKSLLKRMLLYSAPIVVNDIFWWLLQSGDKVIIEQVMGSSELGIYSAATKMQALINIIVSIFSQAWSLAAIKETESEGDTEFFSNVYRVFVFSVIGLCMFVVLFIKPFMSIFLGDSFQGAITYTPLLLFSSVFYAIAIYYSAIYLALGKTVNDMATMVLCAFINIIHCILLIPNLGLWGAVIAAIVGNLFFSLARRKNMKRFMKLDDGGIRYYIGCILLLIEVIAVTLDFYSIFISIACIIAFLLIERKTIISLAGWARGLMRRR